MNPEALKQQIRDWGRALGFQAVGFTDTDLTLAERRLEGWLALGHHGAMAYMERHGRKRTRPAQLVPGTRSVICVRMDYLPEAGARAEAVLNAPHLGYLSRYALGRDYHKLMRRRLARLARRIEAAIGPFGHRCFVDSAPVMEKPLAERAGLGWIGKHSNLLARAAGSWFFLGELYTDLALPPDPPATGHCGSCSACIAVCPTRAIVAPYVLDARRCISYLTIEHPGPIPLALRPLLGNRIYGCDDCQLVCPWNRFAGITAEADFLARHGLAEPPLERLFAWDEATFLARTEGSAIRRIGHARWLRNLAVAMGNAPPREPVRDALRSRLDHPSELVREHVRWALARTEETQQIG